MHVLLRQSLRYKINVTVALTLLLVTLVFGAALAVYENQRRHAAIEQIELSLQDLTAQYGAELGNEIFAMQADAVRATLAEIMKRSAILAITAYDESGAVLVATAQPEPDVLAPAQVAALAQAPTATLGRWQGQAVLIFTSPVTAYGENVGFWRLRYSLATLERQTEEIVVLFLALIGSLAVLIGLWLNSMLVRFVLRPVNALRQAMHHIQGSDAAVELQTGRAVGHRRLDLMVQAFDELSDDLVFSPTTADEIGTLALSFRQMLLALKSAYAGLRTDALTGLNNRMKLDEALEGELGLAQRYRQTFAIVMLDIDHFKKVNDTHGHLIGDAVLKQVAGLLRGSLRKTDVPGRWGGEEFLVLLPQQDWRHAAMIAEKLRAAIASASFPEVGRVTASFGVSEYAAGDTVASLVKRADEALYRAKNQGRNRVESCRPAQPEAILVHWSGAE